MPTQEKACRKCHRIVTGNTCDVCGSTDLSTSFLGYVIIFDPEKSDIAKALKIDKPGTYAIKVG
ncbi:MAG: transcription elongation factor subunit Spt4 [Nitrososphaerota archaeon]